MNMPKQFLNLIGAVAVLAIVAAGVLLIALPLFSQSSATATDADLVAQTNAGYETQIASLRASESDMTRIQADVAGLRGEIPAEPLLDGVFEVVASAAETAGVSILTVSVGETTPWAPRAALTPESMLSTGETPIEAPAAAPETDGTTDGTVPTDGTGTASPETPAVAAAQSQVAFTITVTAPSPAHAQRFIDALGEGTRLIGIDHTSLTTGAESYDLTVNAVAFVRTEN